MIPKIIHYCWFGKPLPERNQVIVDEWKKLHPDFQFFCWGNDTLHEYNIKFLKQAYRKKQYAFVSDYIRLRKVAEYGGFYLDTDMVLLKRLDSFQSLEFVICSELNDRPNWAFFGSIQGSHFLENCFKQYHSLEFDQFKPPVIPFFLKDLTLSYISENTTDRINLESSYFYPMPFENLDSDYRKFIKSNSFGVHLFDFSWSKIKNSRTEFSELFCRAKILTSDFLHFDYSPYYYKINIIRLYRLLRQWQQK